MSHHISWKSDLIKRRTVPGALACLLVVALTGGCGTVETERPIEKERWVEILVELHLANARYELFSGMPAAVRDSIYAHYGVDSAAVARTVEYYAGRPAEYNEVYSLLLDRLVEEEGELQERQAF